MATSLTYAFNRDYLLDVINTDGCDKIVFSLVNLIKNNGKNEAYMYVLAEAYTGDEPIEGAKSEKACPTPPGWQKDPPPPDFEKHGQLGLVPQFAVSRDILQPLVEQNDFVQEKVNQFLVHLEAEITGEGMEPVISLTSLAPNGLLKSGAKATNFTTVLQPV
jgi:hypothetical protein